jgi:3-hydroxyisobutyrate dehydrogenase-like beta-hydroxyacid dehydrogenase
MRVGFVGLGAMGLPMARRLLDAGHEVTVFDVRAAAVEEVVATGALAADSGRTVAENVEVVFTSLPSVESVREAILDENTGVIAGLAPGGLLIEMSTISVGIVREIHGAFAERDLSVLDAPVTQATGMAADGALTIMVGGDLDVLERARPLLEVLGTNIVHMGPAGAGTASKLATQYAGVCNLVSATEAILLATGNGVDLQRLMELAPNSIANSRVFAVAATWIGQEDRDAPVGPQGYVEIFEKDIRLGVEAAADAGNRHDVGRVCAALFAEGIRRGWAEKSYLQILQLLEQPEELASAQP